MAGATRNEKTAKGRRDHRPDTVNPRNMNSVLSPRSPVLPGAVMGGPPVPLSVALIAVPPTVAVMRTPPATFWTVAVTGTHWLNRTGRAPVASVRYVPPLDGPPGTFFLITRAPSR